MKRAVSISLGSSKRNKSVEVDLLGERVCIERVGTDGDMEKAAELYRDLDGRVEAFGVGGTDLEVIVDGRHFPMYSVRKMVRYVKKTPLVDGGGLKNTLERRVGPFMDRHIRADLEPRRALVTVGVDRWGMTMSLVDSGLEVVFGDMLFGLGIPLPVRSVRSLKLLATVLFPIVGRLPFEWLYPTGEKQEKRTPKYGQWYRWATVVAGDCHYIKRYMPDRLDGKVICTNTTTAEDVELFRAAGVRHLVTTTPALEGRSFGTNMMEAALVAVAGKGRPLTYPELEELIDRLGLEPNLQTLNPKN